MLRKASISGWTEHHVVSRTSTSGVGLARVENGERIMGDGVMRIFY